LLRFFLVLALFGSLAWPFTAQALSGGTADSTDRFPFVVEILYRGELICSGTVLFPRIVVTAAHCLQQKVSWRGRQYYVDDYVHAAELSVRARVEENATLYPAANLLVSPSWRQLASEASSGQRFAHDVALIITAAPVDVGLPPSLLTLAEDDLLEDAMEGKGAIVATASAAPTGSLRGALQRRLTQQGMLVAFGADRCSTPIDCGNAGVRRYMPVAIEDSALCFKDHRGRPMRPQMPQDLSAMLPLAVWCMESSVLPGDSGGALLIEGHHGKFYYLGVISAQQGLPPDLAAVAPRPRSVATALYPSHDFILREARKLGYVP
jgi:hypothetical protein